MKRITLTLSVLVCAFVLVNCGGNKKKESSSYETPGDKVEGLQSVYFDYDRSNIGYDQNSAMQSNSSYLKRKTDMSVIIEGNCDERGTNEYNLALGDRRSRSVKTYLVNSGIDPSRLRTISYGEERPVCQDATESCYARNRRADFAKIR